MARGHVFFSLAENKQAGMSIVSTVTLQICVDLDGDFVLTENREGEGARLLLEHGHPFLVGSKDDPLELLQRVPDLNASHLGSEKERQTCGGMQNEPIQYIPTIIVYEKITSSLPPSASSARKHRYRPSSASS